MKKLITCINCPIGCRMTVNVNNGQVTDITGNGCKRGYEYALQESVSPKRMVTAVVAVKGRKAPLSVKTRTPIPKDQIFECMKAIEAATPQAPVSMGDVVIHDVCGTGVDVIATKTVE